VTMPKAWTAFLMILMLLFGSVGVPAFADAGTSGHAVEMLDLECHETNKSDDGGKGSPVAPATHVDHHHCSAAVPLGTVAIAVALPLVASRVPHGADRRMASHESAPPIEPPAA
jgi:hypothetical protein